MNSESKQIEIQETYKILKEISSAMLLDIHRTPTLKKTGKGFFFQAQEKYFQNFTRIQSQGNFNKAPGFGIIVIL